MNNLIEENIVLANYTTLKLGGEARFFSVPNTIDQLQYLFKFAQDKLLPVFILGKGSNVLVRDEGVDGIVINTSNLDKIEFKDNHVFAESGYSLKKLILETIKRNLSGLECLAEIPASIGGSVFMNAGGKFGNIGNLVERCWVVDFEKGDICDLGSSDLKFSYRWSNLQRFFIYKINIRLQPSNEKAIYDKLQEVIDYKIKTQPLTTKNAGCVFKNPLNSSTAILIEQCGLKGYNVGGVSVSKKHSNFFINEGGTAQDLIKLIEIIQSKIYEECGVRLEREIKIWPDEPNYQFRTSK